MIGFLLEDLREWRAALMARTLSLSVIALLCVAAVSMLHPAVAVLAATAISILLGWSSGSVYSLGSSARRLLVYCDVGAAEAVAGKVLSSLVVWLVHIASLSPVLAMSAALSGLRAEALASCAVSWLAAYYLSMAASLIVCVGFPRSNGLAGLFVVVVWTGSTAYFAPIREANPFAQALGFLAGSAGAEAWAWMAGSAALGTALAFGTALSLRRIRRQVGA